MNESYLQLHDTKCKLGGLVKKITQENYNVNFMIPKKRQLAVTDNDRCRLLAELIMQWSVPKDREEIETNNLSKCEIGNLFLFTVAICHQTSPHNGVAFEGMINHKKVKGWDYLLQRFEQASQKDKTLLQPSRWSKLTLSELSDIYRTTNSTQLTGMPRRIELINDLGRIMCGQEWTSLGDIHKHCHGRIAQGSPNLIDTLAKFDAFRDPVKKKSYFLLALMKNLEIFEYADIPNLGAPVDYHEVRGHLRLGTVKIVDEKLNRKIWNKEAVTSTEDIALRSAVLDSIMEISELSGIRNPSQLHYLFWNLFRNYCTRENPNCYGIREESYLPLRYKNLGKHKECACPFQKICPSSPKTDKLVEHVFTTEFY